MEEGHCVEEMDVSLWREFGRMNVCEREELVSKMRALLGHGLSQETAAFFLDMTDWDLQAAVCCYLDTYGPLPPPVVLSPPPAILVAPPPPPSPTPPPLTPLRMRLLEDSAQDTILVVQPNLHIEWTWNVMNNGESSWPEGCVVLASNVLNSFEISVKPIAPLNPGDTGVLGAGFVTPATVGIYTQRYRLASPEGLAFGDVMKIMIKVENDTQEVSQEQQSEMSVDYMC